MTDSFDRFRRDRDQRAFARFVEDHRALVYSVCRRYLRDPDDVEDAVQTTFLKLSQRAGEISGSVTAWLTSTAHTSSVDLIRRAIGQRRRREGLAQVGAPDLHHRLLHGSIRQRLHEAMLALDEPSRQLIVARFFRKEPLRVLAGRCGASVATMSRRVSTALEELATVLRTMGLDSVDDMTLAEHFGDPDNLLPADPDVGEGLRFAPDWRAAIGEPIVNDHRGARRSIARSHLPGWTRPLRVGVFVSYLSGITPGGTGIYQMMEAQAWSTALMSHPGLEFVGIVETGTSDRGPVERVLRDYSITAGLIDSADAEGLATLDVILLGQNFVITEPTAEAFAHAVRFGGVGLLNEHWVSCAKDRVPSATICSLSLAQPPTYSYHHPPVCRQRLPATVRGEHSLLPGLKPGLRVMVSACGPVYRPMPDATVLIEKDILVPPELHRLPELGPARMPVYLVGPLGRGRVVVAGFWRHHEIAIHLSIPPEEYLLNIVTWLAEPRRLIA